MPQPRGRSFKECVLERKPFSCKIAGVPFDFVYNRDTCDEARCYGQGIVRRGYIILDPSISDNVLLDVAFHETIEILANRYELAIPHNALTALGTIFADIITMESQ